MSFFGKLFTRSITYLDHVGRDENYPDIIHVFGAIRIMPDEGESFDIYRYCIIDLNTYEVTNGLQQRGNSFSIKSPFAKRAIDEMSAKLNKKLALKADKEVRYDEEGDEIEETSEYRDLEQNCEFPVAEGRSDDSDTDEPKKLPRTCLLYTKNNIGDRERFTVQLVKGNVAMQAHQMNGMHDYFRHILKPRERGCLLGTYRKENWMSSGGMAFYVIDMHTGDLLHNGMLK